MPNPNVTPGTSFTGPLYVDVAGAVAVPDEVIDNTGGTASGTFTLVDCGGAYDQAKVEANFATIAAVLNGILARLQ